MRNSATTIIACLEGLASQEYPIAEIIVFDNVSTDHSAALVEEFAKRSKVPLRLIRQTVDRGISNSYNSGAELAGAPLLILVHSDGGFPSTCELEKLTAPLLENPEVVAAYPKILMPRQVWERFPFWQKHLFARDLERESPSMCGLFDCVRKDVYLKAGGFNVERFVEGCGYGGEDSDAHHRIAQFGRVVESDAHVIHLHDLSNNYGLLRLFARRKLLARTYGKILQFQGFQPTHGKLTFFVRPALAILPLVPHLFWEGLFLLFAFSFLNSRRMYTSKSTLLNPRILLLPFVDVALAYYETFWFVEGLLMPPADAKRSD
jgi:glycosyltransferase involved in cell wall biosynthesis